MPSKVNFILQDINNAIERNQDRFRRSYLGASSIGNKCTRSLQYSFRHCVESDFDALSLKRFEDGHYSESVYIKRIKDAGYALQHEENGKQYGFSSHGGWFRGHRDGMFLDLQEFGNAIWEHKSSAKWTALEKLVEKDESTALKKWNETYYAQAQVYMGNEGLKWHITTAASEGSRKETICLTEFNEQDFNEINDKATRIIASDRLEPRIGHSAMAYDCRFCDAKGVCWERKLPKPNCRNCSELEFSMDGDRRAVCSRWSAFDANGNNVAPSYTEGRPKDLELYRECHMYMPQLITDDIEPEPVIDSFVEDGIERIRKAGLRYRIGDVTFINGDIDGALSSMEMYENQAGRPWESKAKMVADAFGGKFENWRGKE